MEDGTNQPVKGEKDMERAEELMAYIEQEHRLVVNRLNSSKVEGIHEFIMEHSGKAKGYYAELIELLGKEVAGKYWNEILHKVFVGPC